MKLSLALLMVLGDFCLAAHLQTIRLKLPQAEGAIVKRCSEAFQQALADKQDYESRQSLKCAFNIKGKTMTDLEEAFMVQCQNTIGVRSRQSSEIELTPETLMASFNEGYGIIFRRDCLDTAVSEFHAAEAAQAASAGSGTSAQRECHYRYNPCQ